MKRRLRNTHRNTLLPSLLGGVLLSSGCAPVDPAPPPEAVATPAASAVSVRPVGKDLFASGQPTPSDWAGIRAQGITTVINLRPDTELEGRDEASEVASAGMAYRQFDVSGAKDITVANAARLQRLIDEAPGPVLVHCASGNRVGALLTLMSVENGVPVEDALELGRQAGMTRLEAPVRELLQADDSPSP